MKKVILIITAVAILFTGQMFAFYYANDSCEAYSACDTGGEKAAAAVGVSMGQLIVDGAGYFLNSHSAMLTLLNRLELSGSSGPDYEELQETLNAAIDNMEKAEAAYEKIISIAKETPYNPEVFSKLIFFDYWGYLRKNGLNKETFSRVAAYLSKGDVTGVYILLKSDMAQIIEQLYVIKAAVDSKEFPENSLLWRLNQKYSDSLLSGQYIAEVFNSL